MDINILSRSDILYAEIISDDIVVKTVQDAMDLIAQCGYQGINNIILKVKNITPDFFDLSTGVAGETLQKFTNYRVKLAIVGDFSVYSSKSLKDFIYESNKRADILFVNDVEEAIRAWRKL